MDKEPGILVQLTMLAQGHPFRTVEPEFESRFKGSLSGPLLYPSGFPSGVGHYLPWDISVTCRRLLYLSMVPAEGFGNSQPQEQPVTRTDESWCQIPRLPGPSGEIAVSTWTWAPVAHSGIWLNNAPSICYLLSLGSFPHLCWYFSDITLQIKLLPLKSLTRHLLLGKPKCDTRTQLTTAHRLLKEAHYHPHQQTQRSVQKVGGCASKASL